MTTKQIQKQPWLNLSYDFANLNEIVALHELQNLRERQRRLLRLLRAVYSRETWNIPLTASLVREVENELDRETIR
jgi:hypothetical protein